MTAKLKRQLIGIGGEKGGCGKTTLAVNLAVSIHRLGHSVALLDCDKKPTCHNWWTRRRDNTRIPEEDKLFAKRVSGDIDDALSNMRSKYDYLIVDCGGYDSKEFRYTAAYADLFLAPFQPSIFDTETAEKVAETLSQAKIYNKTLDKRSILVNASNHRQSKSNRIESEQLASLAGLPLMKAKTHSLEAYRETARTGNGVAEWNAAAAKQDMKVILSELGIDQ